MSGEGYSHANQLDTESIVCNDGYSRTTRQLFTCTCGRDAVPCDTIEDACTENVCPAVTVEPDRTVAGATCDGGGVVSMVPTCSFECGLEIPQFIAVLSGTRIKVESSKYSENCSAQYVRLLLLLL